MTTDSTPHVGSPAEAEPAAAPPSSGADLTPSQLEGLRRVLATWLDADPPGRLTASLLSGGRSNLTYVLSDGRRDWILRRPPLGHVLETAHDMRREFRVMSALAGTSVPVPATVGMHEDEALLGAGFYVMERVAGAVLRTESDLRTVPSAAVPGLARAFIDSLALLHAVDPAEVGLERLRPARRLSGAAGAPVGSATRGLPLAGGTRLRLSWAKALARDIPATPHASVVHGDHRLDNAVVDLDGGAADRGAARLGDVDSRRSAGRPGVVVALLGGLAGAGQPHRRHPGRAGGLARLG